MEAIRGKADFSEAKAGHQGTKHPCRYNGLAQILTPQQTSPCIIFVSGNDWILWIHKTLASIKYDSKGYATSCSTFVSNHLAENHPQRKYKSSMPILGINANMLYRNIHLSPLLR